VVTVTGFLGRVCHQDSRVPAEPVVFCGFVVVGWACVTSSRKSLRILRVCHFDTLADRAGIKQALERAVSNKRPPTWLGSWSLLLFLDCHRNHLETLTQRRHRYAAHHLFIYSKIVAALVVLILGLYFANFLDTVVRTSCANAGLEQAASIGRAAYVGTVIFVVAGILEILDIASEIVIWAFILVFGAVCLALALAFGLGGRDVAGRYLEKWLEPKKNESVEPPS
jgi:hypothetical protein